MREQRRTKTPPKPRDGASKRRNFRENDASEEEDVFKDEKTKDEDAREEEETEDEDEDDGENDAPDGLTMYGKSVADTTVSMISTRKRTTF